MALPQGAFPCSVQCVHVDKRIKPSANFCLLFPLTGEGTGAFSSLEGGIQFQALIFDVSVSSCTLALLNASTDVEKEHCWRVFVGSQLLPESLSVVGCVFYCLGGCEIH